MAMVVLRGTIVMSVSVIRGPANPGPTFMVTLLAMAIVWLSGRAMPQG